MFTDGTISLTTYGAISRSADRLSTGEWWKKPCGATATRVRNCHHQCTGASITTYCPSLQLNLSCLKETRTWIWPQCKSMARTLSTPADSKSIATSEAEIGTRATILRSCAEERVHKFLCVRTLYLGSEVGIMTVCQSGKA